LPRNFFCSPKADLNDERGEEAFWEGDDGKLVRHLAAIF
jgi:hypothetical protein